MNNEQVSPERRYFPLEQGYFHVDDECLSFTRSGNWQEVHNTLEQGEGSSPRKGRLIVGGLLVLLGGAGLTLMKASSTGASILTFGLLGLGILRMYNALRHDFAPAFRIPYSKIIVLEYREGHLRIVFFNAVNEQLELAKRMSEEAAGYALERFTASRET
ncbi:MAG: hypothetical protein JNM62_14450 [Flavobacteriales bacterium]|nr:hypothetical protein [Flavobacteriales bacterium]